MVADDVVYEGPQPRERVRGREACVRFNIEGFPGEWHIAVKRIVAEGQYAASWIELTGAEGTARPLLLRSSTTPV
ncbi:MAG TPA: nuclear transport factor 2 family protein [Gaiellaceae bacterium]|nr:nuclear transport factor 2 family protein [Gaiellaceae bacterium]